MCWLHRTRNISGAAKNTIDIWITFDKQFGPTSKASSPPPPAMVLPVSSSCAASTLLSLCRHCTTAAAASTHSAPHIRLEQLHNHANGMACTDPTGRACCCSLTRADAAVVAAAVNQVAVVEDARQVADKQRELEEAILNYRVDLDIWVRCSSRAHQREYVLTPM